jgi:uncharacterized protein (TIGR00730 family)
MRVCVFAGSSTGIREAYADAARALGRSLARRGVGIVYGGGHVGLMGVLAGASLEEGGEVIGVIPEALMAREIAMLEITELHVVPTMHHRKAMMGDLSDAFAALPGGLGTLEELFEVWTWAQLDLHAKPLGLLNVDGYYDTLLAHVERARSEGFVPGSHAGLLHVDADADALLDALLARTSPGGRAPAPDIR